MHFIYVEREGTHCKTLQGKYSVHSLCVYVFSSHFPYSPLLPLFFFLICILSLPLYLCFFACVMCLEICILYNKHLE